MKTFDFGCAPDAVAEGFAPAVKIFHGTLEDVQQRYGDRDVAVVFGARHFGKEGVFEFAVLNRQ